MNKKTKYTIYSILIFLSSGIYFFLAYIGYYKQNIDLHTLDQYSGTVIDKGTAIRESSENNATVFFIKLKGLHETLGIYRMSQEYDDLVNMFQVGDSIKVYYQSSPGDDINIDLIRVEKNGQTMISEEEWRRKESALIYIGLIGGIFSVALSIWYYNKYTK